MRHRLIWIKKTGPSDCVGRSDASLGQDDACVTPDLIASLAAHVPEVATR